MANSNNSNAELEWIQLKKDFDAEHGETAREKMTRKIKDNPFVPLGKNFKQFKTFPFKIIQILNSAKRSRTNGPFNFIKTRNFI